MVNFLIGVLVGVVGLILASSILVIVNDTIKRKEKRKNQSNTNTMAEMLHECAWMCGYIQGRLDNEKGLSGSAKEAYDRNNKKDEA